MMRLDGKAKSYMVRGPVANEGFTVGADDCVDLELVQDGNTLMAQVGIQSPDKDGKGYLFLSYSGDISIEITWEKWPRME